jgi:hypothetical protein
MDNNTRLMRRLRRRIKIQTRHTVEHVKGQQCRFTCKECGKTHVSGVAKNVELSHEMLTVKLIPYWNRCGGTHEICPHCTQAERDRRYPL